MITCIYCKKEIEPESAIITEEGSACNDCAIRPEENHPGMQNQSQQESTESDQPKADNTAQDSPFNLMRAFRELQWIRFKQHSEGETDAVILKRSLTEIVLMMEKEIDVAKSNSILLDPEATLRARFHMLNAVCYGLAYLSQHPGA